MSSDELFAHLEREHLACRVCLQAAHAAALSNGSGCDPDRRYFSDSKSLSRHQSTVHYRCIHPTCRADPHAAFATEYQLEYHAHERHGAPPPRLAFIAPGEGDPSASGRDRRRSHSSRAGGPSVLFTPHLGRAIQLDSHGRVASRTE